MTATVVVTMTTGMVEAVSFVGLGYVFTAMMTGNLLFIGFDLAGVSSAVSQNIGLTQTVLALAAFAFGALTGHRVNGVLARYNDRWLAFVTLAPRGCCSCWRRWWRSDCTATLTT
jgi:uncharacterized membrane protein YoaK (UPF0700 family)